MKYDNIPPIKGSPNIKKAIEGEASPARKGKRSRRPYRVNFICNHREALTALHKKLGQSRAAVLNGLIAKAQKKYC